MAWLAFLKDREHERKNLKETQLRMGFRMRSIVE